MASYYNTNVKALYMVLCAQVWLLSLVILLVLNQFCSLNIIFYKIFDNILCFAKIVRKHK